MTSIPPTHVNQGSPGHTTGLARQEMINKCLLSTSRQQRAAPGPSSPHPTRSWYTSLVCEVAVKLTSAKYRLRPLTRTLALTSDPHMLGTPGLLSTPKAAPTQHQILGPPSSSCLFHASERNESGLEMNTSPNRVKKSLVIHLLPHGARHLECNPKMHSQQLLWQAPR